MEYKDHNITIELTEPMLGTVPKDKTVYASYIASKAPEKTEEEVATVEEIEEKGWTGFHIDEEGLFIYNYMIKGFIKAATESSMVNGSIKKIPAYKKWVDRMVHVFPRRIHFGVMEPDTFMERPLRAPTPKGERTTVCRSDVMNIGRQISFTIRILNNTKGINTKILKEVFDYGQYYGLGQWRGSGGYGSFKVISMEEMK